jgi:hypothetical protein
MQRDHFLLFLLYSIGFQLQRKPLITSKKSGAFVPGIRPGEQTVALYRQDIDALDADRRRLHYRGLLCLPEFLILKWNVPFYFGGTSLLIIVVVTMDFMSQVQAYVMSHQYESLLKKANFKGSPMISYDEDYINAGRGGWKMRPSRGLCCFFPERFLCRFFGANLIIEARIVVCAK